MSNPEPSPPFIALIHRGKALQTPARNELVVHNQILADTILAEWEALGEAKPQPHLLPLTGYAALTLDLVIPQREAVIEELLEYGETDLLCYRETPSSQTGAALKLCAQQHREWQPWLDWAAESFGTHYVVAAGIVPVAQPPSNLAAHRKAVNALSVWQLACLAAVVKPTTSLILGLAFVKGKLDAEELFHLSRLEESHNIEHWGLEEEAEERAENLRRDLIAAEKWRDLC